MGTTEVPRSSHAFVVLNPKSGTCDPSEARRCLEKHLAVDSAVCRIHEPSRDESLKDRIREEIGQGADLVVAAGGDGTVSAVADVLAALGTHVPLGIIPLGTANVLAGELGIPTGLEDACALLAGPHALSKIDAMIVAGAHYVTQVGIGLDALMIRDTSTRDKKRFGRLAYLWTAATRLVGFQPRHFSIAVDGSLSRVRASQVIVANSGTLGTKPFRWGPDILPDDGVLNVCVIRSRTVFDLMVLGWHVVRGKHREARNVTYQTARKEITIATKRPLPVQADGEIVGETPVTVRLAAGAIRVVVPQSAGRP